MTKEEFKDRVYEAFHANEHWEQFLECVGQLYLQATPHWTSVEDELPPKEDLFPDLSIDVLATDGNKVYEGFYNSSIEGWLDCNFWHLDNITHWMDLPLPPAKLSNLERNGKNWKGGEQ